MLPFLPPDKEAELRGDAPPEHLLAESHALPVGARRYLPSYIDRVSLSWSILGISRSDALGNAVLHVFLSAALTFQCALFGSGG